jgi:GNAT superfamily N-acetyltransferase
MDRETAWELFITGFTGTAYARRVATRFRAGPVEAVHFAGDEDRPREPFHEFFARACVPAAALAAIAAARPLPEHYITVLEDQAGLVDAYTAEGTYRLSHSEALMVCDLSAAAVQPPDLAVTIARTAEEAAWFNANDPQGIAWIIPENLADPTMPHYAIVDGGRLVARGRNLWVDADQSYVSRVFTAESHRRRGLAHALMRRILADDIDRSARWSVLTASGMGEQLYTRLGYRSLGTIHIFEPSGHTG